MAIANIDLADGTKVRVDGTPEEIARLLNLYGQHLPFASDETRAVTVRVADDQKRRAEPRPRASSGAMQHIRSLIAELFFNERRSLSDVQSKLEELGRIYPLTHLSTPLRRLVVAKELRRLRNGKNWVYVTGQ